MMMTKIDKFILQGQVDLDELEDRDSYEFSFHEVKAALAMLRQQQALLDGADVIIEELQGRLREKIDEIEALKSKSLAKDELKIMWQAAMSKAYKEEKNEAYEFFADLILEKVREK